MRTARRRAAAALFVAGAVVMVPPSAFPQPPAPVMSLPDAVREALAHNARMLNVNDDVEQASLGVSLARNAFEPKIVPNVQGSFGQTDVPNQTYRLDVTQRLPFGTELRAGGGATTAQIPDPLLEGRDIRFYSTDETVAISQPLLRGFGVNSARRAVTTAQFARDTAFDRRAMATQVLVVDVASAYYRIVAQKALVQVALASLERARKLRDASEAKLDAGLVSQLDVFRAQQLVAESEGRLADARASVEDGVDQLRLPMGRTSPAPFDVADTIPRRLETATVEDALGAAMANRRDLRVARRQAADADGVIAYARNQLLPQLDVNLALTRRDTAKGFLSSFGLNGFQAATFLTISMPVDRTPQRIDYQNSLLNRDRSVREVDFLLQQIGVDARRAVRDVERVTRTLMTAELQGEIAHREVDVAQTRFERGLSNNLDLVAAETTLLTAEARRVSALADLAVARLALRASVGALNPERDTIDPAPLGPAAAVIR